MLLIGVVVCVGEAIRVAGVGIVLCGWVLVLMLGDVLRVLEEASRDLKRVFGEGFVGLLLFGSYSRGEASEGSDVDVLVVVRGLRGLRAREEIYSVLARRVGRPLTLVDVDLADFLRGVLEVTPLLLNALYDGIVVYDELGVLRRLKMKAVELVEKAGLVRYRTPDGKYGWKRADGKPIGVVEVEA